MAAAGNGAAIEAAPAPRGHSRFGASKADRWLNCTASVKAEEGEPDRTTPEAREGTALHAVAALCLQEGQDAIEYVARTFDGVEIDEDHAEAVQTYLDVVRKDKAERNGRLHVERPFHLAWLHDEFWGTGDCARIGEDNVLCVYDAKFGRGVVVEVVKKDGRKNPQLAYYGLGAIEDLKRLTNQFNVTEVELVVVQPRAFHRDGVVRRVRMTHTELLDLSADLVAAAAEALGPDPKFKVGDWCKFCKAAYKCRALRDFAFDAAQLDFDDEKGITPKHGELTVNPMNMSNEQLAHALNAAAIIKDWCAAVQGHAAVVANSGQTIPGYKLVARRAMRKWLDEAAAAQALSLEFGLDQQSIYGQKLRSPAQIEKLLPKEERDALASLYDKTSSGNTLVKADSDRPEVPPTAQSDFDDGQSLDW